MVQLQPRVSRSVFYERLPAAVGGSEPRRQNGPCAASENTEEIYRRVASTKHVPQRSGKTNSRIEKSEQSQSAHA